MLLGGALQLRHLPIDSRLALIDQYQQTRCVEPNTAPEPRTDHMGIQLLVWWCISGQIPLGLVSLELATKKLA